ncbi:unnamed protein product [marine sediment metagenome]|uniref:Uncharacterized protein n=2 Tax=marine sediment metagenome TaxID=412755 RepID=X1CLL7_9ZZZZ
MNYELEMASVRTDMKLLMIEFDQIAKSRSKNASREPREREKIRDELTSTANKFARDYSNLRSRYGDLMFQQDLEEITGKDKADLFLKFKMAQNSKNN